MTTENAVHVERVLPQRADLTVSEVDAILEAAYLATTADGRLSPEETTAFGAVAARLRGIADGTTKPMVEADLSKLFERFAVRSDHAARIERIAALRTALGRTPAREIAYKVAFAMSLADLESSDDEADFDDELIDAFGLTEERADELAGEVYEALDAETAEPEGA